MKNEINHEMFKYGLGLWLRLHSKNTGYHLCIECPLRETTNENKQFFTEKSWITFKDTVVYRICRLFIYGVSK